MRKPPALDDIIAGFHQHGRKFETDLDPHTGRRIRIETDGTAHDAEQAAKFVQSFIVPNVVMTPGIPQVMRRVRGRSPRRHPRPQG